MSAKLSSLCNSDGQLLYTLQKSHYKRFAREMTRLEGHRRSSKMVPLNSTRAIRHVLPVLLLVVMNVSCNFVSSATVWRISGHVVCTWHKYMGD